MGKENFQTTVDNGRLMTRLSIIGTIAAAILLVLVIVLASLRGGEVFALGIVPYSLCVLFGLAGIIFGTLRTSAALEEEEKQLLSERKAGSTHALNVEEDVRFTAGKSFDHYQRYAPYAISLTAALICILELGYYYRFWVNRAADEGGMTGNTLHTALITGILMLASVFVGAFFIGQSRTRMFRWLRALGAWLIAGFALMAGATVTTLLYSSNIHAPDQTVAWIFWWIFAILGVEFVSSFIIEFYRPRTLRENRPIFESRLLSLFTEPGGVMRNIASALDYQFGFKVSGTWLYSFVERSFFPILIFVALIFWVFSMVHEVGPNQVGVKERLGRVVSEAPLPSGIYWTLPWPFGTIRTFSCTELRQIVIGEAEDAVKAGEKKKAPPSQVVLWTKEHGGGEDSNFLVSVAPKDGKPASSEALSVSFIRVIFPIQYRIRHDGVMRFAYENFNPVTTLRRIGQQAATACLASSSMLELMSSDRLTAQRAIKRRIQELADAHRLGIEIVSVTILDAHPPIEKVAPAYQEVIGAMEQRETTILNARTFAIKTLPEAITESIRIVSGADAYRHTTRTVAAAECQRFTKQLLIYNVMPPMFKLREFLGFLAADCSGIRKFVVPTGSESAIFQFNFEAKERLDLLDTDITQLSNK